MIIIRENLGTGRKTCPIDTLSGTNNPWTQSGIETQRLTALAMAQPTEGCRMFVPCIKEEQPKNARLELSCNCHSLYWCLV